MKENNISSQDMKDIELIGRMSGIKFNTENMNQETVNSIKRKAGIALIQALEALTKKYELELKKNDSIKS
jgi:hypothetical protein